MTDVSVIAAQMENPILRAKAMALCVQILAEQVDHDPRLAEALDGIGTVICESLEEIENAREKMKRAAA